MICYGSFLSRIVVKELLFVMTFSVIPVSERFRSQIKPDFQIKL